MKNEKQTLEERLKKFETPVIALSSIGLGIVQEYAAFAAVQNPDLGIIPALVLAAGGAFFMYCGAFMAYDAIKNKLSSYKKL